MLKLTVKPNMTVRKKEEGETFLWKCKMCEEGLLLIRDRGKESEEATWSSSTPGHTRGVFQLLSTTQNCQKKKRQEGEHRGLQQSAHGLPAEGEVE